MRRLWLLFAQAVTIALGCVLVIQVLKPGWWAAWAPSRPTPLPASVATAPVVPAPMIATSAPALPSYHDAASRAAPAVVSIVTSKATRGRSAESDEWFRYFFGDRAPPKGQGGSQSGLGSGVIVSADGYLLTNNHVVAGADSVSVQLNDGRETDAKVVGTDPETDLAVLKIELDKLPVVGFGNSKALRVGDVVLAIGNPFNVGQTVTGGIVSALGRNRLGLSTFENFIQTDAAINPGNSGGALVDATGALVGINTAIFSRSGGNMGIGFAVPADTAQMVLASLVKEGKVTRGWIGVEPRDLNEEFIKTFNLPVKEGVLITSVVVGGPADQAGMRPGDVVVKVATQAVANTVQLLAAVAALKPGEPASLTIQRGATEMALNVTVAVRPTQKARPSQ